MSFFTTQTYGNVTTTNSILGFFANLAKKWNISLNSLIMIFIAIGVVLIIIFVIIICKIRKKGKSERNYKGKKDAGIQLLDEDYIKYNSPLGFIDMTIIYDRKKKVLKIQNMMVGNISCIGEDIPDCYIKVFLLNKDGKRLQTKQTRTMEDNLNPIFPETFSLKIEDLTDGVIHFQLFDENKNGNDTPMGDGELVLNNIERDSYVGFNYCTYVLLKDSNEVIGCGSVCVVITNYNTEIHITLLEAKDLKYNYTEIIGRNAFRYPTVHGIIKVYLRGFKKKKFKTKSLANTRNPYFYESFKFKCNMKDMFDMVLKVEMLESAGGKITKRIGRAFIGNKSFDKFVNELGEEHLKKMCHNPKSPQAMWHALIKG